MRSDPYISSSSPFSEFAQVYDAFMHYIDYPGWVRYICEILDLYNIKGKKLLDLACGTGTCAILFAKRGFDVIGIDSSSQMLEQAIKKIETEGLNIKLLLQDMRNFKLAGPVNIVTCLYDSLNYLLKAGDLEETYNSVYKVLEEGGIFIFDMNTEYAIQEVWGNKTLYRTEGGIKTVWKSEYDNNTRIVTLHLTWDVNENGKKKKHYEIHKEISYSNDEIKNLLKKSGFKEVVIYNHGTFQPPIEVTTRIMVVALK